MVVRGRTSLVLKLFVAEGIGMSLDAVVIGLGYVGLPLVREATRAGLKVAGFDTAQAVVDGLNAGRSHVDDISDSDMAEILKAGFVATTDEVIIAEAAAVVICVPTPLSDDGLPDLGAIVAATDVTARHLQRDTLVILESTTYPGTTEELLKPALEHRGYRAGEDFYLAFSPERVDPGNPHFGTKNTPKVVGGITSACTDRASAFYAQFIDTIVPARGTREAETAKLLENTYRHVNIALVNEMAKFCHELGIDLWDVIRLASTKPFGFQAFYPGPGVGGHCIPIDPNYLSYSVRSQLGYPFRFVELAQEINSTMPMYVARRVQNILNEDALAVRGATVLLLGVTYKPNIADQRESPSLRVAESLSELGAELAYHDPHVDSWIVDGEQVERQSNLDGALDKFDIVVLLQNHNEYDVDALAKGARRFLDTRGVTTDPSIERL